MTENVTGGRVMVNDVRLAFPNLWEAEQVNNEGDYRFGAVLLLPHEHGQVAQINKIIENLVKAKWPKETERDANWAEIQKKDRCCFRNGDDKGDKYDGFKGHYSINANTKGAAKQEDAVPPTIVDQLRQDLKRSSGKPYAGCYVNASLEFWVQDNKWGKRVNCTLRGIQFVRDGDAFSAAPPASRDEFSDVSVGANGADFA